MYDAISTGSLEDKTKTVRDTLAVDFGLHQLPYYTEDEQSSKLLPPPKPEEEYMWADTMIKKGIAIEDVQFLAGVLNPDPNTRLNPRQILETGHLE